MRYYEYHLFHLRWSGVYAVVQRRLSVADYKLLYIQCDDILYVKNIVAYVYISHG